MINRLKERAERREEGFTLIELLIVIVVLGILAAIVVFALSNQTSNAAQSSCKADAKSVEVSQEAYRAQNLAYAGTVAALQAGGYIRTVPTNTYYSITTDTTGGVFVDAKGKLEANVLKTAGHNFDTETPCNATTAGGFVG